MAYQAQPGPSEAEWGAPMRLGIAEDPMAQAGRPNKRERF